MLNKFETIFMFAIVAGLAILIWARIYGQAKNKTLMAGKPCSCGGNASGAGATTVVVNPVDNL